MFGTLDVCLFEENDRLLNNELMETAYDIPSSFPSLHASKSDSSMFLCQANVEEEEQQQQQINLNSSIQENQMSTITNTKRAKKPVSFPFGKW